MLPDLNLPKYDFNLKSVEGKTYIFDIVRKKFVVLTPEEWVRQHLVHFLVNEKRYSTNWMVVEAPLHYNSMSKRADILCYNSHHKPHLIVECKAPSIAITPKVFEQIARYNFELQVSYLLVSNGFDHYCSQVDHNSKKSHFVSEIPSCC